MRLMSFPTWAEAREAKRLMDIVYADDDFFVALIFSQPGVYEGTYEEGGTRWGTDTHTSLPLACGANGVGDMPPP